MLKVYIPRKIIVYNLVDNLFLFPHQKIDDVEKGVLHSFYTGYKHGIVDI